MTPIERREGGSPLLLGRSHVIEALRTQISMAARTDAKVLILGETGVGKDVVARLIHTQSPRADQVFVAVNCSGIPDTLLESELFGHVQGSFTDAHRNKLGLARQADGGTLFLDEVGEMSARMQAVLLRFTETGQVQPIGAESPVPPVNVRLIAATNRDLRARVEQGEFREDLYYRLNVLTIDVPPLRDRADDVLLLMHHFVGEAARSFDQPVPMLTPDAQQLLLAYPWPGNVRQLRNVAERLVAQCESRTIEAGDIPADIREALSMPGRAFPRVPSRPAAPLRVPPPAGEYVDELWARLREGETFWEVVHTAFKDREIARSELAALIDRGLQETNGSYRAMLRLFNLPSSDYKRFHSFLYQQRCNLPVAAYRKRRSGAKSSRPDDSG